METQCVEILLATFNGEKFLEEQLKSLLSQTYQNILVTIRDDASVDRTKEILQRYQAKYPKKIRIILGEHTVGGKKNFSHLMQASKSDYVMFCDQDDSWGKDKVFKTLQSMRDLEAMYGKTTPLLVHTDLQVVDERLNEICPSFWKYSNLKPKSGHHLRRILVQNVVTGCTMLFNRKLIEMAYPIPNEAIMHDWWIAFVAVAFGHIHALDESTMKYRQHHQNQLGAMKYSLFSYMTRGLKEGRKYFNLHYRQVETFYGRYQDQLDNEQKKIIEKYLLLPKLSFFKWRSMS